MIKIPLGQEPKNFETRVRKPGEQFLASFKKSATRPQSSDWKNHDYWNRVKPELRSRFIDCCAYLAMRENGDGEVDHFISKSEEPDLAYEWSNYRFCNNEVNKMKNRISHSEILDPLEVEDGWFEVDFVSGMLRTTKNIPANLKEKAEFTIAKLRLNKESFKKTRCTYINQFLSSTSAEDALTYLRTQAPLIAIAAAATLQK